MEQNIESTIKEKIYVIPLRKKTINTARYKRSKKAINEIKKFIARHLKIYDKDYKKIKIDVFLNEYIWKRGARKPPAKVKVKTIEEDNSIKVELVDLPKDLLFKKQRLEKRGMKIQDNLKKKETLEEKERKEEEKKEEIKETEEKKEELEKKKAAVIKSTQQFERATAKMKKHLTKQDKQPKRQRRMALQK
ncbi:MAG: hypothetical protein KatS3mg001_457 [Candidatus Pacearchaeota archaeon]|nr:MAG: hypothetical protein KatS3mg001_457 [Candidatus Pacearchaeota archaeon]